MKVKNMDKHWYRLITTVVYLVFSALVIYMIHDPIWDVAAIWLLLIFYSEITE